MSEFIRIGRVVRDDSWIGTGQKRRVAIGVLEAFPGQRGATRGRAHDEAPGHLVACCPHGIAGALKTKHGIEDINGNHGFTMGGVARSHRGKGGKRTGFVDAGVQNLAFNTFLIGQKLFAIHRGVGLSVGVINLGCGEVGVHSERSRFVRNDRNETVAEILVLEQVLEQPGKAHGGGNFLFARPLLQ